MGVEKKELKSYPLPKNGFAPMCTLKQYFKGLESFVREQSRKADNKDKKDTNK